MEALEEAILPEAEADLLHDQRKELHDRQTRLAERLKVATQAKAESLRLAITQRTREELLGEVSVTDEQLQAEQQQLGRLDAQLEHHATQKETFEKLSAEIEAQRKVADRWAALQELIGSADGKKFRTFAQGLTLQHLTRLANRHLLTLHGRYRIEKVAYKDLELMVVDTWQGDSQRPMNSLSGGESFLVSLALALGLSDLAGRNTQIRSLFIDEGFGTLDARTLDDALSTLENLQAKGKTIGIISHVRELKERIPVQIRILKTGSGFSRMEIG